MKNLIGGLIRTAVALAAMPAMAGYDGASFLTIAPTAREISLGNISAVSQGPQSLFYNPAGAALGSQYGLSVTHAEMFQQTRLDALAFSMPVASYGKLGLSLVSLNQGRIEGYDASGNASGGFSASDMSVGLSWSQRISRYALGVTVKHVRQTIANYSATGMAADLGLQAALPVNSDLAVGVSVNNLGPKMKFIEESYSLPLSFNVGSVYAINRAILVHLGATHRPVANNTAASLGAELRLGQGFSLRSSYFNKFDKESSGGSSKGTSALSSMVFGLGWNVWKQSLLIDYAMVPGTQDLETTHRMSLTVKWGGFKPSSKNTVIRSYAKDSQDSKPWVRGGQDNGMDVFGFLVQ
jgi:hypothetical protein